MYTFKKDKYQKIRGGTSRVLDVMCEHCDEHIAFYQKDGPGILKRMYKDRFIDFVPQGSELKCPGCNIVVGIEMTYKKEDRSAIRLFAGAVKKKVVSQRSV